MVYIVINESESEESDNDGLPNPAQWLAMFGEEGDEATE